jgi:hypothetical protein
MPLVALHHLVHCGIALASGVLGRAGRRDDRRVHDGATADFEAVFSQMCVDFFEQRRAQTMARADGGTCRSWSRQEPAHDRDRFLPTPPSRGYRRAPLQRWDRQDCFVERVNRSNPEAAKNICSLHSIGLIVTAIQSSFDYARFARSAQDDKSVGAACPSTALRTSCCAPLRMTQEDRALRSG